MTVWSNSYHAAFHFNIMMSSLVLGSIAYDNLSIHSTLFCNHPNRNFWSLYFLRFSAVFRYDIQSAHWKIEKSSFAFSTVVCVIWLSKIKVCRLVVKCAVYVILPFYLFPHTAKWVCRGIYSKRSNANYLRKYAILGFLLWQQNYALNVPRYPWIDNIRWLVSTEIRLWEQISDFPVLGKKSSVNVYSTPICFNDLICDWISGIIISRISLWHHNSRANPRTNALSLTKSEWLTNWKSMLMTK